MKKNSFILLLFLAIQLSAQENAFIIHGTTHPDIYPIVKVFLRYENFQGQRVSDTVHVEKGKFVLRGKLAQASRVMIGFMPDTSSALVKVKRSSTFPITIDNETMELDFVIANQLTLRGSATHDDELRWITTLKHQSATISKAERIDSFIRANPTSGYSLVLLSDLIKFTDQLQQIEPLLYLLPASARQSSLGQKIADEIAKRKTIDIGNKAPNFELADNKGNLHTLTSMKGKYVLLEFWASWCTPCRQENKFIREAWKNLQQEPIVLVSISIDGEQGKKDWLDLLAKEQLPWLQLLDPGGHQGKVAQAYQISGIPKNFLIDPEGNIIALNIRGENLSDKIKPFLK